MTELTRHSRTLSRVLDEPELVRAVRSLPAPALGALVRSVGLEDAGEIVALATPEQLTRVLDEDVWRSETPGDDEAFDGDRFALWLEVLLESGDDALADKLVELPEELVVLGLHRQVLVLDMDALATDFESLDQDEADMLDKALDDTLHQEIDQYRVVSRRHAGWDAVIATLLALDKHHHDFLCRVLERLCHASSEMIDDEGGLYEVLTSGEMIASDAAADREDRRAGEGFVAPSDARAFLALAAQDTPESVFAEGKSDPITRAYFRELDRRPEPAPIDAAAARPLLALLRDAGVDQAALPALPGPTSSRFADAMRALPPDVRARRLEELAFLVNVLLAAGQATRPLDAAELAVEACERGLERAGADLTTIGCDRLFRIGRLERVELGRSRPRARESARARPGASTRRASDR